MHTAAVRLRLACRPCKGAYLHGPLRLPVSHVECGDASGGLTRLCLCRSALILYRQILDGIEKNGYNNFTKRAYVPKWKKFLSLPRAVMAAKKPTGHGGQSQSSPLKMLQ